MKIFPFSVQNKGRRNLCLSINLLTKTNFIPVTQLNNVLFFMAGRKQPVAETSSF